MKLDLYSAVAALFLTATLAACQPAAEAPTAQDPPAESPSAASTDEPTPEAPAEDEVTFVPAYPPEVSAEDLDATDTAQQEIHSHGGEEHSHAPGEEHDH